MQDVCSLILLFGVCGVFSLLHAKKKGSPDYLSNGCSQVGVLFPANVEH